VGADSPIIGFGVHMLIAVAVGMGFGLLVWRQRPGAGELLFWGLAYGTLWWFLGPLTLLPLLRGGALAWSVPAAPAALPDPLGHLLSGASAGPALAALLPRHRAQTARRPAGALLRGALAGLLGAWLLGATLDAQHQLLAFAAMMSGQSYLVAWLVTL